MSLLEAYLTNARLVAVFHFLLFLACVALWIVERVRLSQEQAAYKSLSLDNLRTFNLESRASVKNAATKSEVYKLTYLALSMVRKGELPGAETLRLRLLRSIAIFEPVVRVCLNAFIISGLIGTLFNLWQLGPTFWEGLIQGKSASGYPSIGIAFSASVFGLGFALTLTFIDSLLVRLPRDMFVRKASNGLFDAYAQLLPPTEGAAVANALRSFHDTSTGFLKEFKDRHEEIARQFSEQVQTSSTELITTLNNVSDKWDTLAGNATTKINSLGSKLEVEVQALTTTTTETKQVLNSSLDRLREAMQINTSLTELRAQIETLLSEIGSQLSGFNTQWQADLRDISQLHIQQLETASTTGWKRYEEEAAVWHQKNTEALEHFTDGLKTSISQWSEERQQVGGLIDNLVEGWRRELGQNITAMQVGLAQLRDRIVELQQASTQLTGSNNSAFQQLESLQRAVNGISNNIVNGTPIGAALQDLTQVVRELRAVLASYTPPHIKGGTAGGPDDLARIKSLLEQILQALQPSPANVARRSPQSDGRMQFESDASDGAESEKGLEAQPDVVVVGAFQDKADEQPSFWKKLWRRLRRRRKA